MPGGQDLTCKVYVGDLPNDASEVELEREFERFGKLRNVWVARNPPGFAFIEFEDPRDADDAVRDLDGRYVCGSHIRVEHSSGRRRQKSFGGGGRRGGGGPRGDDRCFECGRVGHFAQECRSRGGGGGGGARGGARSRSRSPRRDRSRSPRPSRRSPSYERYDKRRRSRSRD